MCQAGKVASDCQPTSFGDCDLELRLHGRTETQKPTIPWQNYANNELGREEKSGNAEGGHRPQQPGQGRTSALKAGSKGMQNGCLSA